MYTCLQTIVLPVLPRQEAFRQVGQSKKNLRDILNLELKLETAKNSKTGRTRQISWRCQSPDKIQAEYPENIVNACSYFGIIPPV